MLTLKYGSAFQFSCWEKATWQIKLEITKITEWIYNQSKEQNKIYL